MIRIDSVSNGKIKKISGLKLKKNRDEEGLFIAEGERNVVDGAKKITPEMVFIMDGYEGEKDFPCDVYSVNRQVFEKLSDTKTPQGILGVFRKKTIKSEGISGGDVLLLNGVSDPGNVGTLMRTALAFGFLNIIADKKTADVFSPKVVRSAMSAVFALNIVVCGDLGNEIKTLKNKGYGVYCADMSGDNIENVKLESPMAVIVGNEANGIDEKIFPLADKTLCIPMDEKIESLNAAVAGSIIMYESAAQRRKNNEK